MCSSFGRCGDAAQARHRFKYPEIAALHASLCDDYNTVEPGRSISLVQIAVITTNYFILRQRPSLHGIERSNDSRERESKMILFDYRCMHVDPNGFDQTIGDDPSDYSGAARRRRRHAGAGGRCLPGGRAGLHRRGLSHAGTDRCGGKRSTSANLATFWHQPVRSGADDRNRRPIRSRRSSASHRFSPSWACRLRLSPRRRAIH